VSLSPSFCSCFFVLDVSSVNFRFPEVFRTMRVFVRLLCIISSLAPAFQGYSQTPGVIDPHAISLLEQCRSVMGLPDKSFSLLLQGSIVDTDHDAQPRVLAIKDAGEHRERWEEQYPNATRLKIIDGRQGWTAIGGGKKSPLAISETTLRVPEFIPGFACVISTIRSAMDIQYAGAENRVGVAVDHIHIGYLQNPPTTHEQVINAALADLDIYLDSSTHVVVALKKNLFSSDSYDNHLSMEVQYSSYQTVSGIQIPLNAKHILNGHPIEAVTITNAVEGGAFGDADFK
jgi:hypothetical protein